MLFSHRTFRALCDPMGCSTPGVAVLHYCTEFDQTHIHWVSDAIQPFHSLSPVSPPTLNLSQHQGLFQSRLFASGGQSIGDSASVLPMNIQGWFPFSSVAKLWATLCDPRTVAHQASLSITNSRSLLKLMSIQSVMPPASSSSVFPFSCFQSFPASGSFFLRSQFWASGGRSIGVSASARVLPMNIQGWLPSGLTGLISLQSKGLLRVFSSTTVQNYQFFSTEPSLLSNSHISTWELEKLKTTTTTKQP